MAQDIEIPHKYILNLPKGQYLIQLLDIAQKEVGNSIKLCDFAKYPEPSKAKGYGRYESDKQIIWIRLDLPSHVTEFVVAHELGHSLQQVRGFPRVSIKDILRNFKVYDKQKGLVHPDIIVRIHWLTDNITNLLLDSGADEIARAYGLLTKEALEYLKCKDQTGINSVLLPDFDSHEFKASIEDVLQKVKNGACPPSHFKVCGLLEVVRLATVYSILFNRYSPHSLFASLDDVYRQNLPKVRDLGKQLAGIAQIHKLLTPDGCKEIAKKLVEYLQVPQDAVGVRVADGWLT